MDDFRTNSHFWLVPKNTAGHVIKQKKTNYVHIRCCPSFWNSLQTCYFREKDRAFSWTLFSDIWHILSILYSKETGQYSELFRYSLWNFPSKRSSNQIWSLCFPELGRHQTVFEIITDSNFSVALYWLLANTYNVE